MSEHEPFATLRILIAEDNIFMVWLIQSIIWALGIKDAGMSHSFHETKDTLIEGCSAS